MHAPKAYTHDVGTLQRNKVNASAFSFSSGSERGMDAKANYQATITQKVT